MRAMRVGLLCLIGAFLGLASYAVGQEMDADEAAGVALEEEIRRMLATSKEGPIMTASDIEYDPTFKIFYDPPAGHSCPTSLGVFVWSNYDDVKIYYEGTGLSPTLNSSYANAAAPYIEIGTLFKGSRNRTVLLVGVREDDEGNLFRSELSTVDYFVEASARPYSYGYFIPGIESSGYFVQVQLEVKASARAQAAGSQEFSDFFTNLGIGTYSNQIEAMNLTSIDPDLTGFEGGFPYNNSLGEHFGLLIPYHNGRKYFGKLVKIRLQNFKATTCAASWALESMDAHGKVVITGTSSVESACVHIIDLETLHLDARGFRRGFLGFPYGYLSAGVFQVLVRVDLDHIGLNSTRILDVSLIDPAYGGYSGGFSDGDWACFNPYRTFAGAVGGIRSSLLVDANNLRPYYSSIMLCANNSAWQTANHTYTPPASMLRLMDFSPIDLSLRGFADAIRVGRYAYLVPLNPSDNTYSAWLVRINLGKNNVAASIDAALAKSGNVRSIVTILDLAKVNSNLKGFSGAFTSGKSLILTPYRNSYEAKNGQRGHGFVTRLNMNDFSFDGVEYLDLTVTTRNQIPSFYDVGLRGYSYGFASGSYGLLVPFYNADFNGKVARFSAVASLSANLQELDLTVDRTHPKLYKGFRGGFCSLWQGVDF